MDATSAGQLIEARGILRPFVEAAPSPGELLANRRSRFERAHPVRPSTATVGEELDRLGQACGQCERPCTGFDGAPRGRGGTTVVGVTRRLPPVGTTGYGRI